jgi:3-dehydroquinate synthetase
MKKDKKAVDSKIKFVLLNGLGKAKSGYLIDEKTLHNQLKVFFNLYKWQK